MFNDDGTKTRSGLFFEALRIIEETKPRIAIAENVKNLTSKKFNAQFQIVLESLEQAGYNNYWKILNAKDYGIPQNRERVFIISIRKDIDEGFKFPEGFPLRLRLKDMLDTDVDEKFYLSEKMINYLTSTTDWQGSRSAIINKDIASTINTGEGSRRCDSSNYFSEELPPNTDLKLIQVGQMYGTDKEPNPQAGRVYSADGISPTVDTCSGGNRMPKVAVAMRGRYNNEGKVEQQLEISNREYANSITTVQKDSMVADSMMRIRKLTPRECWRLMGFEDEDFEKAEEVNSNSQLYKQAGNSIVVNVIVEIFKNLKKYL